MYEYVENSQKIRWYIITRQRGTRTILLGNTLSISKYNGHLHSFPTNNRTDKMHVLYIKMYRSAI